MPPRFVIAKRATEIHTVIDAALQIRIPFIDIQRVGSVGVVKQTKEVGVRGCQLVVDVAVLKAPRCGGHEDGFAAMRLGMQQVSVVSEMVRAPFNFRCEGEAMAGQFAGNPDSHLCSYAVGLRVQFRRVGVWSVHAAHQGCHT